MKRIALAAVAACLAMTGLATATAAPESNNTPQSKPPPPSCTLKTFKPFAAKVWQLGRWRRGAPPSAVTKAAKHRIACAGDENAAAMRQTWIRGKVLFYKYRADKLAERRRHLRYVAAINPPGAAVLATIRSCESGGDYGTNTGNGFYGAYQFTLSTWASVGGSGYPSDASPREQDERAAALYRISGSSPWPVCGV